MQPWLKTLIDDIKILVRAEQDHEEIIRGYRAQLAEAAQRDVHRSKAVEENSRKVVDLISSMDIPISDRNDRIHVQIREILENMRGRNP